MEIISGKQRKPFAIILGGVAGVGKSTWAAQAPKSLFIATDEVSELGVDHLPQVKTWDEFKAQLAWVRDHKPKYETLVVDTLDGAESLLHRHILETDPKNKTSMAEAHGGYGKAYDRAATEMLEVREDYLKPIREGGMNVILIVHSHKTKETNPFLAIEYVTNEMILHKKIIPIFKDWVSGVFFADFINYVVEGENTSKTFLKGSGERVLRTTQTATNFGKNRWNLPAELKLEFQEFYTRWKAYYDQEQKPEDIIQAIEALLQNVQDDKLKATIEKQVEENKTDTRKLNRFLTRVQELTER